MKYRCNAEKTTRYTKKGHQLQKKEYNETHPKTSSWDSLCPRTKMVLVGQRSPGFRALFWSPPGLEQTILHAVHRILWVYGKVKGPAEATGVDCRDIWTRPKKVVEIGTKEI